MSIRSNIRRDTFARLYVHGDVTHDLRPGNGSKSAEIAGYAPKTARQTATFLLSIPYVQERIKSLISEQEQLAQWNLERSSKVSLNEFERLKERTPGVAYKYKENLDHLHGLLIQRQESTKRTLNIDIALTTEQLAKSTKEEIAAKLGEMLRASNESRLEITQAEVVT